MICHLDNEGVFLLEHTEKHLSKNEIASLKKKLIQLQLQTLKNFLHDFGLSFSTLHNCYKSL